jgi:hypothetical protein
MKKVYINYADNIFKKEQIFALKAAKWRGRFNEIHGYTPKDIDEYFYVKYKHILEQKKEEGIGYGNLILSIRPFLS